MSDPCQPLSQHVAELLYDMIVQKKLYEPGQRLPDERSLAVQLGISRTSLREAIRILIAEGVLVVRRGVGTFVTENPLGRRDPFDFNCCPDKLKMIHDWFQVRIIVEADCMEYVAANATDEELQSLVTSVPEAEAGLATLDNIVPEERADAFMRMDKEFHERLVQMTHNTILIKFLTLIHDCRDFSVVSELYESLTRQQQFKALDAHYAISRFLLKRDGRGAILAMRYHLSEVSEELFGKE